MWPFISASRFADREREILELRRERAELQKKYDDLLNQFILRGTGIALYPEKLPEALRPAPKPDPGSVLNDPKKLPEQKLTARAALRDVEEQREKEFAETTGKIHAVKTVEVKEA